MRRHFTKISLCAQIILLTALSLIVTSAAAVLAMGYVTARMRNGINSDDLQLLRLQMIIGLSVTALISIGMVMAAIRHLLLSPLRKLRDLMAVVMRGQLDQSDDSKMPNSDWQDLKSTFDRMLMQLREARRENENSQAVLASRTRTVDRLLDFAQTIHGAGRPEQVYGTLSQFLESELNLSAVAILSWQHGAVPPVQVKSVRPATALVNATDTDFEANMCPCLRQNLPRQFQANATTIRCAIDRCLTLTVDHPAYCIPFNIGRDTQIVVHMLLPIGREWNDSQKQLAQTYVNSAVSSLISLHLLAEAEKQSLTDALTGLYNRRSMEELLQREVALAERHKHPLSVVMVDIDFFKQVNDVHGHAAGDHLLKSFADCVRITLRKTDLAFRYGGDEFVIALPQTPIDQAEQVVSKLRQAFAAVDFSHAITRLDQQPTLSIGVTERSSASNILTLENLLSAADQALYNAKSSNRNCVKVYPPRAA